MKSSYKNELYNIAFFVSSIDSGGLENYLLRFLQYKSSSFNNIYVYCKSGVGGQLESEYLKLTNVEIVKHKIGYLSVRALKKMKNFLISENIDAVCDFGGNFSGNILMVAKSAKIKTRIAFYRGATNHFKRSFVRNLYNDLVKYLVYKNATDILSNSKAAFDYFYSNKWEKDNRFKVIYNGIESSSFINENDNLRQKLDIPDDAFVVGHTGRYNEAKNHSSIIKVAELLIKEFSDIYFIMCGNGVKENLHSLLVERGIDKGRILLFENRRDIPKFLNTMNCYYFPSITEGQPNSLIEAMIVGLPFVASNIDPIKETVTEQYYNQLVDACDTDSAKSKIIEIKENMMGKNVELSKMAQEKYEASFQFGEFLKVIYSNRKA